jgi:hypothetical protein
MSNSESQKPPQWHFSAMMINAAGVSGIAQPNYVEIGTLPVSTASERAEGFDATAQ